MFYRKVNQNIDLYLANPIFANELFKLTDKNRHFLRQWLPWLDKTKSVNDTKKFLNLSLLNFSNGKALIAIIKFNKSIVGVAGFNSFDNKNFLGYIGYWLAKKYNGHGIMTSTVNELIKIGKEHYKLKNFEIRCAPENIKSKAIPKRLGFSYAGEIKKAENLYGSWIDHEIYKKYI